MPFDSQRSRRARLRSETLEDRLPLSGSSPGLQTLVAYEDSTVCLAAETVGDEISYWWDVSNAEESIPTNYERGEREYRLNVENWGPRAGEVGVARLSVRVGDVETEFVEFAIQVERVAPSITVDSRTVADGQGVALALRTWHRGGRTTASWQIDWGDGTRETIDGLGDSLSIARLYPEKSTAARYDISLILIDNLGFGADESYELTSVVVPGRATEPSFAPGDYVADVYFDAEKSGSASSNLCWCASAANALYYTGWATNETLDDLGGSSVAFYSEDDVFDYFVDSFTNKGSSALFGLEWFFTSEYEPFGVWGWAQPSYSRGGFYDDVAFDAITDYYSFSAPDPSTVVMTSTAARLQNGWGVCAALGYYESRPTPVLTSSHTITIWGYECDENYALDDPRYFVALLATDSDDGGNLGRDAENVLKRVAIEWNEDFGRYLLTDYNATQTTLLEELICLAPKAAVFSNAFEARRFDFDFLDARDEDLLAEHICRLDEEPFAFFDEIL